ncbi:MAG: DMT family transporter, partial [Rhodobacteraceae bacterium]|nr:DMT family transporter [Paracoccaceae bacterium]
AGVMMIVRPGTDGFDRWSVLGLLSVACVVMRDLATRRISGTMPSVTVAFLAGISVTLGAALVLPFTDIAPVSPLRLAQLGGAAAFLIIGYMTVVMAMRVGDVAMIAPFRYASLVAAILLGWLVFGQWPDHWTLIGSAIVVATGVYTFSRERLRTRQMLAQMSEAG